MIAAPYKQLLWKEYRSIRGFWIALAALAIGLELLVLALSENRDWSTTFVYNVALATPVFFAIGCIATAFAVEKEEGTFDWLQASPATDGQVFWTKLGLCLVATAGMFLVMWPLTMWLADARMPGQETLGGMLGLWLVAALEVVAWGMLFSLLSARPLASILLALVVTSAIIHVVGTLFATGVDFEFTRYLRAVPVRLLIVAPVVVADLVLGLRWLSEREPIPGVALRKTRTRGPLIARGDENAESLAAQFARHDRAQSLGRLFWQTGRQSWRLMLILATGQVGLGALFLFSGLAPPFSVVMIAGAALMGACVFLSDQERNSFRFFVEHNVPPRLVWLSRIAPWTIVAALSTLACAGLFFLTIDGGKLIESLLDRQRHVRWEPLLVTLGAVGGSALAFLGGQWISMLVRSGLLSGVLASLLAAVLTGWGILVVSCQLPLLYFVAPLLLLFPWASWLRAPDWIEERTTRPARAKAAAAVLVPSALLAAALPPARVAQVPSVSPGFEPAQFLGEITPAALETGQLYRRANELAPYRHWLATRQLDAPAPLIDADFEAESREAEPALALILAANERDACALANPATLDNWPVVNRLNLVRIVLCSGQLLEADGKLDEALQRYQTAFTVDRQLTSHAPNFRPWHDDSVHGLRNVFDQINYWAAQLGQSPERLRAAIGHLQGLSTDVLNTTDSIKANYILCQRVIDGDPRAVPLLFSSKYEASRIRLLYLAQYLPWEVRLEQRLLNLETARSLMNIDRGAPLYSDRPASEAVHSGLDVARQVAVWDERLRDNEAAFELQRRATLIRLACQVYRLEHGKLPEKLEDLVGKTGEGGWLETLPVDPFSDRPFVYFPQGIPRPRTESEQIEAAEDEDRDNSWSERLRPEIPCLWSPGFSLATGTWRRSQDFSAPEVVFYAWRRWGNPEPIYSERLPEYTAWRCGVWLPIPHAAKPAAVNGTEPENEGA